LFSGGGSGSTVAADLKFLHRVQQVHHGGFKSKSRTRIMDLRVRPLLPEFV
jgi:hypothetical protein